MSYPGNMHYILVLYIWLGASHRTRWNHLHMVFVTLWAFDRSTASFPWNELAEEASRAHYHDWFCILLSNQFPKVHLVIDLNDMIEQRHGSPQMDTWVLLNCSWLWFYRCHLLKQPDKRELWWLRRIASHSCWIQWNACFPKWYQLVLTLVAHWCLNRGI